MTKKQRLAKLLKAAEDLQYNSRYWTSRLGVVQKFSCNSVSCQLGSSAAYNSAVAASESSQDLVGSYTAQSQLARQLAVLMYREGVKRGKYD